MKHMNAINNNRNIEILLFEMMCLYKNINQKGISKIVDYTRLWYVLDSTPVLVTCYDIFYYDDSSSKK